MITKRFFFLSTVTLFSALMIFTACSSDDDPDYHSLITGQWLFLDEQNTDDSFVMTFNKSTMHFKSAEEFSYHGYFWYTSNEFPYVLNDNILDINGSTETGITFQSSIRINSIEGETANLTVLEYKLDNISISSMLGTYAVKKSNDTSSQLLGVWKGYEPGNSEILFFYDFKYL